MTTVDPRADLSALHGPDGSGVRFTIGQYVALTKPRIIELLLITTIPVMFLAEGGVPSLLLVLTTLVGGTLSAGAANTLNCYLDRDIDAVMHRTSKRPLVTGTVSPRGALVFGATLAVVSTLWLGLLVNWLSAWLALGALLFYVVGYTLRAQAPHGPEHRLGWRGRVHARAHRLVCGDGHPQLVGRRALPRHLLLDAAALLAAVDALPRGLRTAHVPMLPVVERFVVVARQIVAYSWAMVLTSLSLVFVGDVGWVYTVGAVVAGALFLTEAHRLLSRAKAGVAEDLLKPMRLFHFSITYLTVLFIGVAIDPLWHVALPGLS